MKITIHDVAKKGGVSISTASKALNGRRDVGEKTKKRIRRIARDLKYEPFHFAGMPRVRRVGTVGAVIVRGNGRSGYSKDFYYSIIDGLISRLDEAGLNLVINVVRNKAGEPLKMPEHIMDGSVDGVILLGRVPAGFIKAIKAGSLSVVIVENSAETGGASSIMADAASGTYMAVEYLINSGHKNIVFIDGGGEGVKSMEQGYRKALIGGGEKVDGIFIIRAGSGAGVHEAVRRFKDSEKKPDAVFVSDTAGAVAAVDELKKIGISVPEDISVIGYGSSGAGIGFSPSISTVGVNGERMGKRAVDMLTGHINDRNKETERVVFPVELIIRESVKSRV